MSGQRFAEEAACCAELRRRCGGAWRARVKVGRLEMICEGSASQPRTSRTPEAMLMVEATCCAEGRYERSTSRNGFEKLAAGLNEATGRGETRRGGEVRG